MYLSWKPQVLSKSESKHKILSQNVHGNFNVETVTKKIVLRYSAGAEGVGKHKLACRQFGLLGGRGTKYEAFT